MYTHVLANITVLHAVNQEKISGPSHNAFAPNGIFVQVVMWGDSDETYLN